MALTTTAAGVISEPLQIARTTLANCTEFQAWTGTSNAADALERIHLAGLPPTTNDGRDEFTETEIDNIRPFAIVESNQAAGNTFVHHGTSAPQRHYKRGGEILIYLEQAVSDDLLDDPAELDRQFQNTLGAMIFHETGSGLLDLSGTAGYLAINMLTVTETQRASNYERVASGDAISAIFEITWGNA